MVKQKLGKILSILIVVGLVVVSMVAISQAQQKDYESILEKVQKTGVLTVGVPTSQRWSVKDIKTGEWEGISIDIMDNLANSMENVKVQYKEVGWDTFPIELKNGTIDIFAGTAHYTVPRAERVAFPHPVFWKGIGCICKQGEGDKYETYKALNDPNVKVAVGIGTYEDHMAEVYFPQANLQRMKSGAHSDLAQAVRAGQADLACFGHLNAYIFGEMELDWAEVAVPPFAPSTQSFPVRQGDIKWFNFINAYFRDVIDSGFVRELVAQRFPNMPEEIRWVKP